VKGSLEEFLHKDERALRVRDNGWAKVVPDPEAPPTNEEGRAVQRTWAAWLDHDTTILLLICSVCNGWTNEAASTSSGDKTYCPTVAVCMGGMHATTSRSSVVCMQLQAARPRLSTSYCCRATADSTTTATASPSTPAPVTRTA
jgi:hypothetical protein